MKISIELGDDVLRVVDELASRTGRPRQEIIAAAVGQQTAAQVLTDLFADRSDGMAEDDAAALAHEERAAMRAERRHRTASPPKA